MEELAWDWKSQLFIRFTAEGNIFGQTGRTYSWQQDCKEALREKDEGILIDGQKKRKSTLKDKDNLK